MLGTSIRTPPRPNGVVRYRKLFQEDVAGGDTLVKSVAQRDILTRAVGQHVNPGKGRRLTAIMDGCGATDHAVDQEVRCLLDFAAAHACPQHGHDH